VSYRDGTWLVLGWQIAIACRFAADLLLDLRDRRQRRARTAQPTDPR
jgi:hypothetical protein